jgi:glycosyltransferase involved in cell wall biosynthesis
MKNFFDCSINKLSNSLHSGTSLVPIENDMMLDLGKYANHYGWKRVYDYQKADLIITNGFYTDEILEWSDKHSIAKIKRMDGIYWQTNLKHKNDIHNGAAIESDHVIFISHYSLDSLYKLYGFFPKTHTVILNNVDETIFYPIKHKNNNFTFVTSATNWNREEKRLGCLVLLSKIIDKNDIIRLIGKCDYDLPSNIIKEGYIDDYNKMNQIISKSDAFLSLFFRDAGSKVTCQGVACNLPILFSNTGGLIEIIKCNGTIIKDYDKVDFLDETPELSVIELLKKYKIFKKHYKDLVINYKKREETYQNTLSKYFEIFKLYI